MKIKELLEKREKLRKKLSKIDAVFKQEKENEEAWSGHAGNVFQYADLDYQVYLRQLELIEEELKKLGYKV